MPQDTSTMLEDFARGRISSEEAQEIFLKNARLAERRARRLAVRRPFLAVGIAVATGYLAGRLVTRW